MVPPWITSMPRTRSKLDTSTSRICNYGTFEGVGFVRVAWDAYIVSFESEDKHKRFTMHVLARW